MKRFLICSLFAFYWLHAQDKKGGASYVNTFGKGAAAVSRTVEDKLRDGVSIKDFGAQCDGTDDITAIQASIDAVSAAGGGTVEIPNGCTTIITAHPVVPSNVALVGRGWSSIIKVANNAWPIAKTVTDATDTDPIVVTVAGHGWLTGQEVGIQGVTGNTAANGAWYITWISADTFSLNDSGGSGAYAGGGNATLIAPGWKTTGGYDHLGGIVTSAFASNVSFRDFTLDLNGANQTNPLWGGDGLSLIATSDSLVENVRIIGMRPPGRMIGVLSNTGGGNRILNNTLVGYGGPAATCAGGIYMQIPDHLVQGNHASNLCDEAFIPGTPGSINGRWINNTYLGNNILAGPTAFHVEDSSRQTFTGNVCRGWTVSCFNIAPTGYYGSSSTDITLTGNLVEPDGANKPSSGMGCIGDGFGHTVTGVSANGNTITGTSGSGFGVGAGCSGVTGHGNTIRNNTAVGFYTDNANSNIDFTYNTLTGNNGGGGAAQITTQSGPLSPNDTIVVSPNSTDDNTNGLTLQRKHGFDTVASAATITPAGEIFHVSGVEAISTINLLQANIQTGMVLHMIADAAFTVITGGNIGAAAKARASEVLSLVWDGNLWWPFTNYQGVAMRSGPGTEYTIPVFDSSAALADSILTVSGSQALVNAGLGSVNATLFERATATFGWLGIWNNTYYDGAWKRFAAGYPAMINMPEAGGIQFHVADTGAKDSVIAWIGTIVDAAGAWEFPANISVTGELLTRKTADADIGGRLRLGYGAYQWQIVGNELVGGDLMIRNPAGENILYFPQAGGYVDFLNDRYLRWKDSAGTAINILGLDASNNFHVGPQVAPASAGDTFFYARGDDAFKLMGSISGDFTLEPINDYVAGGGLIIGTSTKRVGPISAVRADFYSNVAAASIAQIALQTADEGSFVNLRGGAAKGSNYNLLLPSAPPGAANKILATTSGTYNPLVWVDLPAGTIGGSGTIGTIPKFSAASTLADSVLTESGTGILVSAGAGSVNAASFERLTATTGAVLLNNNAYYDAGWKRFAAGYAERIDLSDGGGLALNVAATGAKDSAISWITSTFGATGDWTIPGALAMSGSLTGVTDLIISRTISGADQPTLVLDSGITAKSRLGRAVNANRMDVQTNISFDGSNWNLDDESLPGSLLANVPGTSTLVLYYFTAGTNPRTANLALKVDASGNTGFAMTPGAYRVDVNGAVNASTGYYVGGVQISANSVLTAACSAQLVLTTSYQDVAGATLALDRVGTWMVTGTFQAIRGVDDTGLMGRLDIDGSPVARAVRLAGTSTVYDQASLTQTWVVTIASQPKTIKLQAIKVGTGISTIEPTDTTLTAAWIN